MIRPNMFARMIKWGDGTGNGVDTRQVRPLVKIAMLASECEIGKLRGPAVLAGNDVLYVECEKGILALPHVAILAAIIGAFANQLTD
jgi:hypothetical protein